MDLKPNPKLRQLSLTRPLPHLLHAGVQGVLVSVGEGLVQAVPGAGAERVAVLLLAHQLALVIQDLVRDSLRQFPNRRLQETRLCHA